MNYLVAIVVIVMCLMSVLIYFYAFLRESEGEKIQDLQSINQDDQQRLLMHCTLFKHSLKMIASLSVYDVRPAI